MSKARVKVIKESKSGENQRFKDMSTGDEMTKKQFISKIENNYYEKYHVREKDGKKIPASNPDKNKNNNLG